MTSKEEIISNIKFNYTKVRNEIIEKAQREYRNPGEITLIAVSKTFSTEILEYALESGIRIFGENYAQEVRDKIAFFEDKPVKPHWHFIGHLQTNKVKYLIPYIKLIHTVDSFELASEINKRAEQYNLIQNILIQVNTSSEETKYGILPEDAINLSQSVLSLHNLNLIGLMTIGTFSTDESVIREEFSMLRNLRYEVNNKLGIEKLTELSMGMSNDYLIAIEEGSTILRVGTAIFGERNYSKT